MNSLFKPDAGSPRAHLIELSELAEEAGAAGRPIVENANPLHQVKTTLQVCVGHLSLSIGELMATKEHQVLRLEQGIDQPVDLQLEGKTVARGQLVAVDGHFAIRITELPVALQI